MPEQWTPEQIRQFQDYWDALLEGNLAARRHTRFVPGGLKYQPIRDVPLKDEFDEWLARVVCFAFSIPPTAFSKQTNRATAETSQNAATAEGLQPLLVWLKGLIDRILAQVLGCDDLEFAWTDRTAPDPQTQATIAAAYVAAGIKTRNEVRAELGLDPVAGGDALTTAGPAAPLPGGLAKANFDPGQPRDGLGWWTRTGQDGPTGTPTNRSTADPSKVSEVSNAKDFTSALMGAVNLDTGSTGFETAQGLREIAWLAGPESPVGMAPGGGLAWLPFSPEVAELGSLAGALGELGTAEDATAENVTARLSSGEPSNEIEQALSQRPSWRQSEQDVGHDLGPSTRSQVGFQDGIEVRRGTSGSVQPDHVDGDVACYEVKNYDIATNMNALIRRTADQAIERVAHLPEGMVQNVIIDIRGQTVSEGQQLDIVQRIVTRARGAIDASSIEFKE